MKRAVVKHTLNHKLGFNYNRDVAIEKQQKNTVDIETFERSVGPLAMEELSLGDNIFRDYMIKKYSGRFAIKKIKAHTVKELSVAKNNKKFVIICYVERMGKDTLKIRDNTGSATINVDFQKKTRLIGGRVVGLCLIKKEDHYIIHETVTRAISPL